MSKKLRNYGSDEDTPSRDLASPVPVPESQPVTGATPGSIPIVVSVEGGEDRIHDVAERLREFGMDVPDKYIHDKLNLISGSADPSQLDALREVPGVIEVKPARTGYGFG